MKKYLIGAILGFVLSFGTSAHAEVSSLLNQVVQNLFPVTVDGKPMGDAIVVNNKTYLPVREFGEVAGYKVDFTADSKVVLTKKPVTPNPKYARYLEVNNELTKLLDEQLSVRDQINNIKGSHATMDQNVDHLSQRVNDLQAQIDKLVEEKKALEESKFK